MTLWSLVVMTPTNREPRPRDVPAGLGIDPVFLDVALSMMAVSSPWGPRCVGRAG